MAKAKRLSRKQLALAEDLFRGDLNERQVLDKHKLGRQISRKWRGDGQFAEEVSQLLAGAYRQSTFLIARNAPSAAKKLIELTGCGKEETARKACPDIITINPSTGRTDNPPTCDDKAEESTPLPPETASRLLAVLAGEGNNHKASPGLQGVKSQQRLAYRPEV